VLLAVLMAGAGAVSSATAGEIPLLSMAMVTDAPGDEPMMWTPAGVQNPDGTFSYTGSRDDIDGHWSIQWDYVVDTDPFISAGISLINMDPVNTLTFTFVSTLPIAPPVVPSSLIGGSTGGSLTDANANGVGTVGTSGGIPFFFGQIDGANVLPIYPDPSSWSVSFPGETVNIPAANVGLPGPTIPGPQALSDIGIQHRFTLTPGDRVALTSFFQVEIPEPATAGLLLLGSLVVFRRRR
jgi:hypothetical protein